MAASPNGSALTAAVLALSGGLPAAAVAAVGERGESGRAVDIEVTSWSCISLVASADRERDTLGV